MDCKAVIEKQIQKLEKVQDAIPSVCSGVEKACKVAETILLLCREYNAIERP